MEKFFLFITSSYSRKVRQSPFLSVFYKLEIHSTPKHGSWLNMAEIEFAVLSEDCLSQRIGSQAQLARKVTMEVGFLLEEPVTSG